MIAGIILAGGMGTRIGGGKPLLSFGDGTLLDAVIAVARPQVDVLAINIPDVARSAYESYTLPLVADSFALGTGPLAGIVAGLEWANGKSDWLATFPCDTPFLPNDLVSRLYAVASDRPVAAEDAIRPQGLCALWPVACAAQLRAGVEDGHLRSITGALEELNGLRCRFDDADTFFNINTPEDLERAKARL